MTVPSIYESDYANLRSALRLVRLGAELTQTELAQRLGVGQSYVSKIERGEAFVEVLLFVRWCQACGADPGATLASLSPNG